MNNEKIKEFLSLKLYNNSNLLNYNIFNSVFKNLICNKKLKSKLIEYNIKGFAKDSFVDLKKIQILLNEIKKQVLGQDVSKMNVINFKINNIMQNVIQDIINEDLSTLLKDLEHYYNSKIFLGWSGISRNFNIQSDNTKEVYSNNFHCDSYLFTAFKVFINLQDVTEKDGPMTLVRKDKAKQFINKYKYKSRNKYNFKINIKDDFFYENTGKIGQVFLCNTSEVLHKAGIPEKNRHRDMLFLHFLALPKEYFGKTSDFLYLKNVKKINLFDNNDFIKKFSKPTSFLSTIKMLKEYYKNKNINV